MVDILLDKQLSYYVKLRTVMLFRSTTFLFFAPLYSSHMAHVIYGVHHTVWAYLFRSGCFFFEREIYSKLAKKKKMLFQQILY